MEFPIRRDRAEWRDQIVVRQPFQKVSVAPLQALLDVFVAIIGGEHNKAQLALSFGCANVSTPLQTWQAKSISTMSAAMAAQTEQASSPEPLRTTEYPTESNDCRQPKPPPGDHRNDMTQSLLEKT